MGEAVNTGLTSEVRKQITITTVKWLAIWLISGGILNFFIMPYGIDYFNRYYITALYFAFCGVLGAIYYRLNSLFDHHSPARLQFFQMLILTALIFAAGITVNLYFPIGEAQIKKIQDSKLVFPLFYASTWVAKLADVAFQQIFIFALLKELRNIGLEQKKILTLFTLVFGALHLPLLFLLSWSGLYFIIPSLIAGFIFSYLILNYRNGVFYSFAVHMVFYFILGLLLRYVF